MSELGERITQARMDAGLSKSELARRAKVTKGAIGNIESGNTKNPIPNTLYMIAAALDVDPEWIVYGEKRGSGSDFLSERVLAAARRMEQLSQPSLLQIENIIKMAEQAEGIGRFKAADKSQPSTKSKK